MIVVVVDDQAIDSLRYWGRQRFMPYFKSAVRNPSQDWTTFRRTFTNDPLCCPSRATILTGQNADHTGVWCVQRTLGQCGDAFRDHHTLATWLHTSGYRTGLFGKYLNWYPWDRGKTYIPPGWDAWHAVIGSFGDEYFNYHMVERRDPGAPTKVNSYGSDPMDHSTVVIGDRAAHFVARARQPFFAYIATSSPHGPAKAEAVHQGAFDSQPIAHAPNFNEKNVRDKPTWVRSLSPVDPAGADQRVRKQLSSLLDVDSLLEQVFTAVRQRGVWDNTVVVYVSDNGYSFGSHRWEEKRCLYEECVRVPMYIRDPIGGITHRTNRLTSNADIAPTIEALTGIKADIPQDGRSLVPLLKEKSTPWRHDLFLEYRKESVIPTWYAVRTDRYMYAELRTGEKELYDLHADPSELQNVSRWALYRTTQHRLHCRLKTLMGSHC